MVLSPCFLDARTDVAAGIGSTFGLEFNIFTFERSSQIGVGHLYLGLVKQFLIQSVSFQGRVESARKNQFVGRSEFDFSSQCCRYFGAL